MYDKYAIGHLSENFLGFSPCAKSEMMTAEIEKVERSVRSS
jgi:hypothetical protein